MIASTTCEAKCFISLKKKDREKSVYGSKYTLSQKINMSAKMKFHAFSFYISELFRQLFLVFERFQIDKDHLQKGSSFTKVSVYKHPLMVLYQPLVAEFNLFFSLNLTSIMTQVYL